MTDKFKKKNLDPQGCPECGGVVWLLVDELSNPIPFGPDGRLLHPHRHFGYRCSTCKRVVKELPIPRKESKIRKEQEESRLYGIWYNPWQRWWEGMDGRAMIFTSRKETAANLLNITKATLPKVHEDQLTVREIRPCGLPVVIGSNKDRPPACALRKINELSSEALGGGLHSEFYINRLYRIVVVAKGALKVLEIETDVTGDDEDGGWIYLDKEGVRLPSDFENTWIDVKEVGVMQAYYSKSCGNWTHEYSGNCSFTLDAGEVIAWQPVIEPKQSRGK
jgi:hypothetical protein